MWCVPVLFSCQLRPLLGTLDQDCPKLLGNTLSYLTLNTAFSGIGAPENTVSIMSRAIEHFVGLDVAA